MQAPANGSRGLWHALRSRLESSCHARTACERTSGHSHALRRSLKHPSTRVYAFRFYGLASVLGSNWTGSSSGETSPATVRLAPLAVFSLTSPSAYLFLSICVVP